MTPCFVHTPTGRRRQPAARPIDLVLVKVLRASMERDWAPEDAAADIVHATAGQVHLLRTVRVRLLTRVSRSPSEIGERALATIAVALREVGHRTSSAVAR